MAKINFNISDNDQKLVKIIVRRACAMAQQAGWTYNRMDATMDIIACHLNGMSLDLSKLNQADDFTFAHDVFGIRKHLNRESGIIEDCFTPRCHKRQVVAA